MTKVIALSGREKSAARQLAETFSAEVVMSTGLDDNRFGPAKPHDLARRESDLGFRHGPKFIRC